MIALVSGHHLITGDSVGDRVHDGPLGRRRIPPPLRFLRGQFDRFGSPQIHFQTIGFDKDPGPDDLPGF